MLPLIGWPQAREPGSVEYDTRKSGLLGTNNAFCGLMSFARLEGLSSSAYFSKSSTVDDWQSVKKWPTLSLNDRLLLAKSISETCNKTRPYMFSEEKVSGTIDNRCVRKDISHSLIYDIVTVLILCGYIIFFIRKLSAFPSQRLL